MVSVIFTLIFMIACSFILIKRRINRRSFFFLVMLAFYSSYLLYLTVLCREPSDNYRYRTAIFWSYRAVLDGKFIRLVEITGNIILFVPVGMLLFGILKRRSYSIGIGILFSLFIESLQLFTKRGVFVIDDIIHNSIGVFLGVGLWIGIQKIFIKR